MTVSAELSSCKGARNRICVRFPYSQRDVANIKTVPGRSFVGTPGDKHWHVPLDMETCRSLREAFGDSLAIGPQLRSWAFQQREREGKLGSLAASTTGRLECLWGKLPKLAEAVHLGPRGRWMTDQERAEALAGEGSFQAADTRFLVESPAPLLANEQGTGKTLTWIAAVWEAGLEQGCHLVVAPKAAVGGTWRKELLNWQSDANVSVGVYACVDDRSAKEETIDRFLAGKEEVKWLVVNPAMITYRIDRTRQGPVTIKVTGKKALDACTCGAMKDAHEHYEVPYPELLSVKWSTVAIDEAHKNSVRNHKSLTSKALRNVRANAKPCILTGTPMKKKGGSDLWGILNYLRPDVFSSFWQFAESYFAIEDNGFGKKVGELRPERQEAFFRMLTPYACRRLKKEVAPWLPEKLYVPVDCFMSGEQAKQYKKMQDGEPVELGDMVVESTGVLAEFTRLRQFANARWKSVNGTMMPVESCKYDALLENLEQSGTLQGSGTKHLVFSNSKKIVDWTAAQLRAEGYVVDVVSGSVSKQAERDRIMEDFQEGGTQVLCIVTTAGGVSLTLDAADDVHLLDESWSHDEDEQAEDRAHRVSRIHQVTVYIYRTVGTVDAYVAEAKEAKLEGHALILDVRRRMEAA